MWGTVWRNPECTREVRRVPSARQEKLTNRTRLKSRLRSESTTPALSDLTAQDLKTTGQSRHPRTLPISTKYLRTSATFSHLLPFPTFLWDKWSYDVPSMGFMTLTSPNTPSQTFGLRQWTFWFHSWGQRYTNIKQPVRGNTDHKGIDAQADTP